ncbi:uncharacterized protein LOC144337280 [Macaca mulatta]
MDTEINISRCNYPYPMKPPCIWAKVPLFLPSCVFPPSFCTSLILFFSLWLFFLSVFQPGSLLLILSPSPFLLFLLPSIPSLPPVLLHSCNLFHFLFLFHPNLLVVPNFHIFLPLSSLISALLNLLLPVSPPCPHSLAPPDPRSPPAVVLPLLSLSPAAPSCCPSTTLLSVLAPNPRFSPPLSVGGAAPLPTLLSFISLDIELFSTFLQLFLHAVTFSATSFTLTVSLQIPTHPLLCHVYWFPPFFPLSPFLCFSLSPFLYLVIPLAHTFTGRVWSKTPASWRSTFSSGWSWTGKNTGCHTTSPRNLPQRGLRGSGDCEGQAWGAAGPGTRRREVGDDGALGEGWGLQDPRSRQRTRPPRDWGCGTALQ